MAAPDEPGDRLFSQSCGDCFIPPDHSVTKASDALARPDRRRQASHTCNEAQTALKICCSDHISSKKRGQDVDFFEEKLARRATTMVA